MINDEVLRKAATEANQVITESLPSSAACAHSFSPTFHKKMQRTIRRGNHPLIARLPKQIACFIISAVIIGGTWLTVDAEARTAFLVWVRETYVYIFNDAEKSGAFFIVAVVMLMAVSFFCVFYKGRRDHL